MGIVHDKYEQLKPELLYLCDEVVLAQAWKKSHSYIRAHNWYADTLELDCSTVNLEKRIKEWAEQLHDQIYSSSPIRLVPAPKTDHWTFYKPSEDADSWKWGPKEDERQCKELRPLAHINIQDQTVATAIMLCLADAVETAQGNTDPEGKHKVWNYGNRLFCDWEDKQAIFRWGNSNIYSKYFQDYQRFLERPLKQAQKKQQTLPTTQEIFEIHLDLSAFYDSIDREQLIEKLQVIAGKHYEVDQDESNLFWEVVKKVIREWKWFEGDTKLEPFFKKIQVRVAKGLPQGMVASGFFANAYLISLDNRVSEKIGEKLGEVTIIDYCRYVDDLRLLVHIPVKEKPAEYWENWVKENIQHLVEETKGMKLNPAKTKVERYTAKRSGVSVRMKAIQRAASGPQDMMALDEMQGSLEGLFALAEQFRDQSDEPQRNCPIPLAQIEQSQMDVREDTLMRFAANRLATTLSKKRLFATDENIDNENVSVLDHVYESFARRFVAVWTRNPSLVAILKKGIQLYPHPQLLRPVFESLSEKLGASKNKINPPQCQKHEGLVAAYCFAEIYRFAALDLHRQKPDERPQHSDWNGLKSLLIHQARVLLGNDELPWYVEQQIALFMTVCEEPVNLSKQEEIYNHKLLCRILQGDRRFGFKKAIAKQVPLFLIAYQISSRPQRVIANLGDWLDWLYRKEQYSITIEVLSTVAISNSNLFEQLLLHGKQVQSKWNLEAKKVAVELGINHTPLTGKISHLKEFVSVARLIKRQDNPFVHENALLDLALSALTFIKEEKLDGDITLIAPHNIEVECNNWEKINQVSESTRHLKLRWAEDAKSTDNRYKVPNFWLTETKESQQLYKLGSFLRACATGNLDFTIGQHFILEDQYHAYFGVKSCWYKRRMGMAHSPEALIGATAPMSSWISELLYRLLQWPGLKIRPNDEWPENLTLSNLKNLLLKRIKKQERIYGRLSHLPVYIERIHCEIGEDHLLRIVMAQSLLPKMDDFSKEGPELSTSSYRRRHGGHIATIARLICDKLIATRQAGGVEKSKSLADLIIFPELAVHENDIKILKNLADKTGAMIFAGLVYRKQEEKLINTALWLIPFKNGHGRQWIMRYQGKQHMTSGEKILGISPWRPYQLIIELTNTLKNQKHGFRLSGSICYDATDIAIAADLKDVTNAYIVPALNQDTNTFDTMVDALHYHMYQPVILVNTGQFGGSCAKAPYKEKFHKLIAHVHGNNQIAISMFELNMYDFGEQLPLLKSGKEKKTAPAGLERAGTHSEE